MSSYDQWKTDPDFDGRQGAAIEAMEQAEMEEGDNLERLKLKSAAFDAFADFMRRIEHADRSELADLTRLVARMPDLLLTYRKDDDIKF